MSHFVWQLILAGLLVVILIIGTFYFIVNKLNEMEMNRNFASAGLPKLLETIEMKEGQITFDEGLLEKVRQQGGWLQALNEDGEAISSFYTPKDVPRAYKAGELVSYINGQIDFPYILYIWIQEKDDKMYTLLYGVPKISIALLHEVKRATTFANGQLELPPAIKQRILDANYSLQILNAEGNEIVSVSNRMDHLSHYTAQEITLRAQYSERYNNQLYFEYDVDTEQTWLLHEPLRAASPADSSSLIAPEIAIILMGFLFLTIVIIVIFIVLSVWYGYRFGTPILHMMSWLQSLAHGQFDEPRDLLGQPRSVARTGKIKRKYRMYQDIIESLRHLTESLKRNDDIRDKLQLTREEWITGVTHDMKTPLSSIMGYAHMLKADVYHWTEKEVREFAAIISDKADYMDLLIADLSLTYRLDNLDDNAYLLNFERIEINGFVRKCMVQFMNDPKYAGANLTFEGSTKPIFYSIDANEFRRIMDNLLANAVLHNPPGTHVSVILNHHNDGFDILFQDDGAGMDEDTVHQLFERYYRGTNTEGATHGTGLGMAIAKQLVSKLGGTIQVFSTMEKGTSINLKFSYKSHNS